ncbi:DNA primase large subunit [Monocercomonoides exilis]|uniref:DNA primase large subunit n=1 Tax=Monocercomonoides exilis TaxID=2049356 RepID=UPI00355A7E05|nr:DNA primase large subunit [Monocercomonoides exilis]|eukprot:MONOS_15091.1-p1 / transcript=MONOS_15091.1 / gene=MONOS_15091 / organism=Monocercomonoides_exilis_PA203 / gene_product=DNA primase large subunit / transcript_product=DNA primase large subunit / location=Mono_scaffold01142:2192-4883(-) / protein_length=565 / sequence_SO=supercontig / SO=protein_coding / is_pseudo=false
MQVLRSKQQSSYRPASRVDKYELSFYNVEPTDTVSLDDFYQLGFLRSQFHKRLLELTGKTREEQINIFAAIESDSQFRPIMTKRGDQASHWIYKLACAKNHELARTFVNSEVIIFSFRYTDATLQQQTAFINKNNFAYDDPDDSFKKKIKNWLQWQQVSDSTLSEYGNDVNLKDYFLVPWQRCPTLIQQRRAYLCGSVAVVHRKHLCRVFETIMAERLQKDMDTAANLYEKLSKTDPRICTYLEAIIRQPEVASKDVSIAGARINNSNVDAFAAASFPLCMMMIHRHLRRAHHLKYEGRVQYQLFLKGCGMGLEETMALFRGELTQTVGDTKFEREYAYGIRYNYGLEGKRANFKPKSCRSMISGPAPSTSDQCHGCPFAWMQKDELRHALIETASLTPKEADEVYDTLVEGGGKKCEPACAVMYYFRHGGDISFNLQAPMNPLEYFVKSRNYYSDPETLKQREKEQKEREEMKEAKEMKEMKEMKMEGEKGALQSSVLDSASGSSSSLPSSLPSSLSLSSSSSLSLASQMMDIEDLVPGEEKAGALGEDSGAKGVEMEIESKP